MNQRRGVTHDRAHVASLGTVFEWEEFNPQRKTPRLRSTEVAIQYQASFSLPTRSLFGRLFLFLPAKAGTGASQNNRPGHNHAVDATRHRRHSRKKHSTHTHRLSHGQHPPTRGEINHTRSVRLPNAPKRASFTPTTINFDREQKNSAKRNNRSRPPTAQDPSAACNNAPKTHTGVPHYLWPIKALGEQTTRRGRRHSNAYLLTMYRVAHSAVDVPG